VGYLLAAWSFFRDRIPHEEHHLAQFYGEKYVRYAQSTIIGIPGIASPLQEKQP